MSKKRTSVEYTEEDIAAIEEVREKFGLKSDIAAVRLSIRILRDVDLSIPEKQIDEITNE